MSFRPSLTLSEEIAKLLAQSNQDDLCFSDLAQDLSYRAHALVCFILCLPFLLPIPLPGLSSILGIFVIAAGVGITSARPPWLPFGLAHRKIPRQKIKDFVKRAHPWLLRLDRFISPRLSLFVRGRFVVGLHGAVIIFMAILLTMPGPPGSNFPPSLSVICLSLALLKDDGLMSFLGFIFAAATAVVFGSVYYLGFEWLMKFFSDRVVL